MKKKKGGAAAGFLFYKCANEWQLRAAKFQVSRLNFIRKLPLTLFVIHKGRVGKKRYLYTIPVALYRQM